MSGPLVVTLILAAGKGERMGGPKALLGWREPDGRVVPLALAHASARLAAESARVLVVARAPVAAILARQAPAGTTVHGSDASDELGPAGSIACAVPHLGDAEIVLITPVDGPPARADTVAAILGALGEGALAARPRFEARGGHPVALLRAVLARYGEPSPPPLREHLRALGPGCREVAVEDPNVVVDLDEVGDLGGFPIERA